MNRLPPRHPGVIVLIILGFMLLPLSTDMYLASLPGLRRYFDVSVPQAQLTLSVFVVGFAISQLAYGPCRIVSAAGRCSSAAWPSM